MSFQVTRLVHFSPMDPNLLTRTIDPAAFSLRDRLRLWTREEFSRSALTRSLTGGVLLYLLESVMVISFSALIFAGEIGFLLPVALGFTLFGNALLVLIVSVFSSYAGSTAVAQDTPGVVLGLAVAAMVAAMPAAGGEGGVRATVFVLVFGSTLLMGLGFLAVGVFKLGNLVRYLPYPVMGGFLAGTGWLLLLGGIGVMQELSLGWGIFTADRLLHWLPGVLVGVLMLVAVRRMKSAFVLAYCFLATLVVFYMLAWLSGAGIDQLFAQGWLLGPFPESQGWSLPWSAGLFAQVDGAALLAALPDALPAVFLGLVALLLNASSLELVIKKDLDLNHELKVLGLANAFSGLAGGLMGYHAISLSTLNHTVTKGRRLPGLLVALLLLLTVLFGTTILSFTPRILLGSLLAYVGIALLYEWLVEVWARFSKVDVFIVLTIFATIVFTDFLLGIGLGLILTVVLFVVSYSRINVVRQVITGTRLQSRMQRDQEQQEVLRTWGDAICILQLEGFIFFGTANSLYEQLHERIRQPAQIPIRYVILDFDGVSGLDSTGLLSFRKLLQYTQLRKVTLLLSGLSPQARSLFQRGGFSPEEEGLEFCPDLDYALEWSETRLIKSVHYSKGPEKSMLERLGEVVQEREALDRLFTFASRRTYAAGEYLMAEGDPADEILFVESGQVTIQLENPGQEPIRLETTRAGGVIGELGFFLQTARTAHVVADQPTVVLAIDRPDLERMKAEDPDVILTLSRIVVQRTSQRVVNMTRAMDILGQ